MEHLAHVDAVCDRARRVRLRCRRHDEERSLSRARRGRVNPLPKWIEHGEPGGVSCTTRQSSPLAKSASSRQPRPS